MGWYIDRFDDMEIISPVQAHIMVVIHNLEAMRDLCGGEMLPEEIERQLAYWNQALAKFNEMKKKAG